MHKAAEKIQKHNKKQYTKAENLNTIVTAVSSQLCALPSALWSDYRLPSEFCYTCQLLLATFTDLTRYNPCRFASYGLIVGLDLSCSEFQMCTVKLLQYLCHCKCLCFIHCGEAFPCLTGTYVSVSIGTLLHLENFTCKY